ncbi:MAG: DUF1553 domain-containing protein, partial [Planctomycetes bacterium]|nr:DUF1553 domain-containing protein [Planctomycetota bacterium]
VLPRWQRQRVAAIDARIDALKSIPAAAEGQQVPEARAELQADALETLEREREWIAGQARMTMVTQAMEPREIRILPRGNWLDDSGPVVEPAIPEFLGQLQTSGRRANRLDLANWLVDAEQGLGGMTARVFANRYWYLLFGRGLCPSLADFGGQGQPPTHPELLDHLAIELLQKDWSAKWILRRLLLTHAYRQASDTSATQLADDPYNELFARQARYRLPAEIVRDNALSISGMLAPRVGGPSIKPHQPAGYYRHLNFPKRVYVPDRGADQYRRGVYAHWQRQFLHPMLKAMDAPSREECVAQRPRSNTPLEALVMLNDPSMVDASIAFASRLLSDSELSDAERIEFGFQLATARTPDPFEQTTLLQFLEDQQSYYQNHAEEAESLIDSADKYIDTSIADPVLLAAWTGVARAILNLHETVSRH